MKCQEVEKLILLKGSGEMAPKQANSLSAHLNDCKPCQQFQQVLIESQHAFQTMEEPSVRIVQNILREARVNAPEKKRAAILRLKPALAMAASVMIGLGIFLSAFSPDKVGMELVMMETQLMEFDDQLVSIMYSGLSEDDLAFNFIMTYEEG